MPKLTLYDYQLDAVEQMKNGCILCGGVGSGKSRTSLTYYYMKQGGFIESKKLLPPKSNNPQKFYDVSLSTLTKKPKDLYIITTARKRDTFEWGGELAPFLFSIHEDCNYYKNTVVVDSWNNIGKYMSVKNAFFIFDEQRVIGYGAWTKAFLNIAKNNDWILLSATPGDKWEDYIPVFIANGFYKNKTHFVDEHINYRWEAHGKYPKVDSYRNTGRLIRLRNNILVTMDFKRSTVSHHEDVHVGYDISKYKNAIRTRTDPFIQGFIPCQKDSEGAMLVGTDISEEEVTPIMEGFSFKPQDGNYVKLVNKPIEQAAELCYVLRRIVNSDDSRSVALLELLEDHPKAIIFYNFDYELAMLKEMMYDPEVEVAEWNGHKHQEIPTGDKWVYLVQYTAGCEGWNCITTDTIIFFSQNYSYKVMVQASGRIDRLTTPYTDLYYYHLKSKSGIDLAISKALQQKKNFNEGAFVGWSTKPMPKAA